MAKQSMAGVVFKPIDYPEISISLGMAWVKPASPLLQGFLKVVRSVVEQNRQLSVSPA